ncbi:MAG: hypothetical protein IIX84_01845 [Oscillospiraceae bacterium]|nr:hypothetical protein [Oscillospiraceae bacterium]
MHIDFSQTEWNNILVPAHSKRFTQSPRFTQKEGWIENKEDSTTPDGYEYVGLVTKEKFGVGSLVSVECDFHKFGAPLITLAQSIEPDKYGELRFGFYYELVLYEKGINFWHHYTDADGVQRWHLDLGAYFPVEAGVRHKIAVGIRQNYFDLYADDKKFSLHADDMAQSFHVGPSACEGINRFFCMDVTKY